MRLIIRPDAESDIAQGHDWYEAQREGLGREFMEEVSSTIAAVQSEPRRFPLAFRGTRRALIHRFPYGVFFLIRDESIAVAAVMHLARDPRRLSHRSASR